MNFVCIIIIIFVGCLFFDKNTGELVAPVTKVRVGTSTKEYKPQTLRKLFANLKDVTEIDLMYLNTTDTIDMNYLFYSTTALTELDLSTLDTKTFPSTSTESL